MKPCYFLIFLFSGCTLQEPYRTPELDVPCEWNSEISQTLNIEKDRCFNWWKNLQDPVLDKLMVIAAEGNLDLQIGMMRVLKARSEANGKKGDFYPRLDGNFTCGHVSYNKKALENVLVRKNCLGNSNFNFFELGFDAEWELDFFGKTAHEIAALQAQEEVTQEELSSIWVTLSAEIAKNYIELRGLQSRYEIIFDHILNQEIELTLKNELKERGILKVQELNQIIADQSYLKTELFTIEIGISKAIHRISILLGYNPGELIEYLSCLSPLPELPRQAPIGFPSELLQRRPDIRKAERKLAAATEQTGSAIASLFPRISLFGFIGEINSQAKSLFSSSSFTWALGPQVIVPIFNSKLMLQDIEFNKLSTQEALYVYQRTVLEALEEAENAITAYVKGNEKLKSVKKAQFLFQEAETHELELYQRGISNNLHLLTIKNQNLTAKDRVLQEEVEQILRYIALYKALGGSWENPDCIGEFE